MLYVGLDVHGKKIVMCVLNSQAQIVKRLELKQVDELLAALQRLGGQYQVAYEASCGYGWLYELLSPDADRVVVAHPGKLAVIFRSKQKTDRRDAEWLAKLLMLDMVPPVHVPSAEVRQWRELITFRTRQVEKRTRAKVALRALLRNQGITPPRRPGLWSRAGHAWIKALPLPLLTALKRDQLIEEIEAFNNRIRKLEELLTQFAERHPRVAQLQTIPGVGPRTAEAMAAFLDDPRRFTHSKQVGAYFGLVPRQDQSGSVNRLGHITREGSAVVRRLLTEAVWQARKRSPRVQAFFDRVQREDPERKKIAVVATAHYLARVMWSMLRRGTVWQEAEGGRTTADQDPPNRVHSVRLVRDLQPQSRLPVPPGLRPSPTIRTAGDNP